MIRRSRTSCSLPLYAHLEHPTREGGDATDDAFSLTVLRLLTSRLAVGGDSTWLRRAHDGFSTRTGFGITHLLIKGLVCENDPHEALISASLIWGIGDFGTKAVGGYGLNTLQPSLTFGKGFGDLPDSRKWLRPFAIAGAIAPEFPINGRTKPLLFDPSSDQSHYGYLLIPTSYIGGSRLSSALFISLAGSQRVRPKKNHSINLFR